MRVIKGLLFLLLIYATLCVPGINADNNQKKQARNKNLFKKISGDFSLALGKKPQNFNKKNTAKISTEKNNKYLGRATWQNLTVLGVTYIFYLADVSTNRRDWQYGLNFKDQWKRFFTLKAIELDNNNFGVNTNHVSQGYLTHLIARSNNLDLYESLFFDFVSSSFWEYVMEYRENISLNDQFFATFGGFSVGESFFQIGKYLSFNRGDNLYGILSWILAAPLKLNNLLFKTKESDFLKKKYLTDDFTRRFEFSLALSNSDCSQAQNSQSNLDLLIDLRLLNTRLKPGKSNLAFSQTFLSRIKCQLSFFPDRSLLFFLKAGITYWGNLHQDFDFLEKSIRGSSFLWGICSAFEFHHLNLQDYYYDKYMAADLLGLNFIYSLYAKDLSFKVSFSIYGSFLSTQAAALEEYRKHHKLFFAKTVLVYHDYYHAFGYSLNSELQFFYKNFEIITSLRYRYADSIEGLDRYQETIINDFNIIDKRFFWKISTGYFLAKKGIKLFVDLGEWVSYGYIKDVATKNRIFYTKMGFSFLF